MDYEKLEDIDALVSEFEELADNGYVERASDIVMLATFTAKALAEKERPWTEQDKKLWEDITDRVTKTAYEVAIPKIAGEVLDHAAAHDSHNALSCLTVLINYSEQSGIKLPFSPEEVLSQADLRNPLPRAWVNGEYRFCQPLSYGRKV